MKCMHGVHEHSRTMLAQYTISYGVTVQLTNVYWHELLPVHADLTS